MKRQIVAVSLCIVLGSGLALYGCGEEGIPSEVADAIADTSVEATVAKLKIKDKRVAFYYTFEYEGETYTSGGTWSVDGDTSINGTAVDFFDEEVEVLDADGNEISIEDVEVGDNVTVTHDAESGVEGVTLNE